jgi:adenylate kinase family enzyme
VLVAGTSGSGKTTTAARIGAVLEIPHTEIDSLYHGPDWTPRPTFEADVHHFAAAPAWVTEWQYSEVRAHLAARAELLVWLDLPRAVVMRQVIRRTLIRRLRREKLWNGNEEGPLWTIFTVEDHIIRWAWRSHPRAAQRVLELVRERPDLPVVRLRNRKEVDLWVRGPLTASPH